MYNSLVKYKDLSPEEFDAKLGALLTARASDRRAQLPARVKGTTKKKRFEK